ncbi:MAG: Crp/Fnr family transcriptional regulator [Thermodesulfovibrionales bacterium]
MKEKYKIEEFFRGIPIFRNLSDSCIREIISLVSKQRFSAGEIIYQAGDTITSLFIVETGKIEIYKTDTEGNRLTLWFINPREVFCIPTILFEMAIANAIAIKDTVVYCIDKHDFDYLIRKYPDVSYNLLYCLSGRIMNYSDSLETIAFSNAKVSTAKMLLKYNSLDDNGNRVVQLSQSEIASLVGTSRETVCRVLNQFKREKLITVRKRKIIILDIDELQEKYKALQDIGGEDFSPP